MARYYYTKSKFQTKKYWVRLFGITLFSVGILGALYTFFPALSWQLYFAHAYSQEDLSTPIPKTTVVQPSTIAAFISNSQNAITGVDYTNAQNWFPSVKLSGGTTSISGYRISIPTLGITSAEVSADNYDLSQHLINYPGTPTPPDNGNAVIFGHSSLPQLFNQKDYKTIFATLYKMKIGDTIIIHGDGISYTYTVFTIMVTDPTDTSIFEQNYDTSYLTLVTCTPPGTTWKRLIVKGRLEKI